MSQRSQVVPSFPHAAQPQPPLPDFDPGESWSAVWDGELGVLPQAPWKPGELGDAQLALCREYHLIGSAMREGAACEAPADLAFARSVMARLQTELYAPTPPQSLQTAVRPSDAPAANDSVFRWKAVASVATLAAVLSMGWQWGGGGVSGPTLAAADPVQSQTVIAVSPPMEGAAPVRVQTAAGQMLRDPQLEALMAAHRQLGGVSALQMPAGFVRNATFEVSVR